MIIVAFFKILMLGEAFKKSPLNLIIIVVSTNSKHIKIPIDKHTKHMKNIIKFGSKIMS